ncbi:transmembrane protein 276 [Phaenicophaeus curvirostris]|uniref:transmembrane protein 276 n=1 Tax=Phaenicophaeus curvirostris TaxID=33595 RepID=UPI0037F0ACC1
MVPPTSPFSQWKRPPPHFRPSRRSSPPLRGPARRPEVPLPVPEEREPRRARGPAGCPGLNPPPAPPPALCLRPGPSCRSPCLPSPRFSSRGPGGPGSVPVPVAAGPMGAAPGAGEALLGAVCLWCALRARQVSGGPAPGFLLQALGAASDALAPWWPWASPGGPSDPVPGSWVSAVLGQPLVAFGFHHLSGDRATGNLLLAVATVLAPVAAGLAEEARLLAARAVTVLVATSLLSLAALTGNGAGALGAVLVAAGYLGAGHPWAVAAGNLALERGLRAQLRHPENWDQ